MSEVIKLWVYAKETSAKEHEEKGYIQKIIKTKTNFIKPMKLKDITSFLNSKYSKPVDNRQLVSFTSLHFYEN